MRIKNTEKFREELYRAFRDAYIWCHDCRILCAVGYEPNEQALRYADELPHYEKVNDEYFALSLPQPLVFGKDGYALTVDADDGAVSIWNINTDEAKHFELSAFVIPLVYRNKTAFIMGVVRELERLFALDREAKHLAQIGE